MNYELETVINQIAGMTQLHVVAAPTISSHTTSNYIIQVAEEVFQTARPC